MTYTSHSLTGTAHNGQPFGTIWSVQSWDDVLYVFGDPSQDLWRVNLDTYVATQIGNAFGPQTGSAAWDGDLVARAAPNRGNGYRLDSFSTPPTMRQQAVAGNIQPPADAEEADDVRLYNVALASDGTTCWYFTRSYFYVLEGDPSNPTILRLGPHGLRDVQGAAYWPPTGEIIVATRRGLLLFDQNTRDSREVQTTAPGNLTSLTVHEGQLVGATATHLLRFTAGVEARAAQVLLERDKWEVRLRERKSHAIVATLPEADVISAEFSWRAVTAGGGRLSVNADTIDSALLRDLLFPSEATGGLDVEFYREHALGADRYLGVVASVNLKRGATTNTTTINVGGVENSYLVLGDRTSGTGEYDCRLIAEVGDDLYIASRGLHEGLPVDGRGSVSRAELEAIGRARVERSLRQTVVDHVDFARAQRVDVVDIYLTDPWGYLGRRFSNPGVAASINYGGVTGSDYLGAMLEAELNTAPGANERDRRLDVGWRWLPPPQPIGASFGAGYVRERLLRIAEECVTASGLTLRYDLDESTDLLELWVRSIRNRTLGSGNPIVLTDGGETVNPDSVLPGDLVDREIVVGDVPLFGTSSVRSISATAPRSCASGTPLLTAAGDLAAGLLVLQRRIEIDGRRGLQVLIDTGDIAATALDVQRAYTDLGNTARVT